MTEETKAVEAQEEQAVAEEAKAELGIKETEEAVEGVFVLALFLAKRLKDGAGVDDAVALFSKISSDEEFKAVVGQAYEGIDKVPAEIKDIDFTEGVVLAKKAIDFVPRMVEALKK